MSKDELIEKKLEYLENVLTTADQNDEDEEKEYEYLKALNSAIQTYRDEEKAELEKDKVKNQKEIEKLKIDTQKELDTLRINNQLEIEKIKADVAKSKEEKPKSIGEQVLEWAKVVVPVVVPIIAYGFYQERMLKFEETGTIHSKTGREMHLPKFMK